MSETQRIWKDPIYREVTKQSTNNPAGDSLQELDNSQLLNLAGGAATQYGYSKDIGNEGKICTWSKECVNFCN